MATTTTTLPYFLYSSGILFREGLEALLVIIALAAWVFGEFVQRRSTRRAAGLITAIALLITGYVAIIETKLQC